MMSAHRTLQRFVLAITIVSALVGCHSKEPESPSVGLTRAVEPAKPVDLGRGAPRFAEQAAYNMYVAPPVREICAGPPPFFAFDSSEARTTDHPTMQILADCMLKGPLREKAIKLIGRTDPRGTDAYNLRLGLERAERVKGYLVDHGVDANRIVVESAGEAQATATPDGWATDRRVEVQLLHPGNEGGRP